jgi:hypothetical protein
MSLDGFVAYDDNDPGALFDWYEAGAGTSGPPVSDASSSAAPCSISRTAGPASIPSACRSWS